MVEKSYYHINKSLQEFKKVLEVNNIPSDNENGGYRESDNGAGSGCQASHTSLADTSGDDNSVQIDSENIECDIMIPFLLHYIMNILLLRWFSHQL